MPRFSSANLQCLSPVQREVFLTMRLLDPELSEDPLWAGVAELLPPGNLFGDDRRQPTALYRKIRNYLFRHGSNIESCVLLHKACTWNLKNGRLQIMEIDIKGGRTPHSKQLIIVSANSQGSDLHLIVLERAHNVAMQLKDVRAKFSGDMSEYWGEEVDVYYQIARDCRIFDEQKLQ